MNGRDASNAGLYAFGFHQRREGDRGRMGRAPNQYFIPSHRVVGHWNQIDTNLVGSIRGATILGRQRSFQLLSGERVGLITGRGVRWFFTLQSDDSYGQQTGACCQNLHGKER